VYMQAVEHAYNSHLEFSIQVGLTVLLPSPGPLSVSATSPLPLAKKEKHPTHVSAANGDLSRVCKSLNYIMFTY
jgi:hypothetical protein